MPNVVIGRQDPRSATADRRDAVSAVPTSDVEKAFAGHIDPVENDRVVALDLGEFDGARTQKPFPKVDLMKPRDAFNLASELFLINHVLILPASITTHFICNTGGREWKVISHYTPRPSWRRSLLARGGAGA